MYRSWRGQVEQADTSAPSLVKAEINRPGEPVDRALPSLDRVYWVREGAPLAGVRVGPGACVHLVRAASTPSRMLPVGDQRLGRRTAMRSQGRGTGHPGVANSPMSLPASPTLRRGPAAPVRGRHAGAVQRAPDDGWSSVVHQAPYVVDDALATVFGAGVHQDTVEATWDDAPLRQRGITPRSASTSSASRPASWRDQT